MASRRPEQFRYFAVEKRVSTPGVALEDAVGLRLTFRQPPPIDCCTSEFLFCLTHP